MTPDNGIFYHVAYTVVAVIYVGYAISLRVRERRLRDRLSSSAAGDDRR